MDTRLTIRRKREENITIYKNPNSDATAFLFHGLGGRWDQWQDQISALKDKYTLIIPHLYGHGKSDKPKPSMTNNPYSFLEFNEDMHSIFDRFKSEKNSKRRNIPRTASVLMSPTAHSFQLNSKSGTSHLMVASSFDNLACASPSTNLLKTLGFNSFFISVCC